MADINIKDVAARACVSTMTVTRTINNPELVKKSTREKVQAVIRELGYVPDRTAMALRSGKSKTIGIALFDIENPFISKLVMRMERRLKKRGYTVLLSFVNEEDSDDYDSYTSLKSFNVDLCIFIPTQRSQMVADLSPEAASKCLQLFRMGYSGMDAFVVDDIYGAYLGTKHLLENGHERILLVDFQQRMPMYRDRGYYQAFQEMGVPYNEDMVLKLAEFNDGMYAERIQSAILEKHPTAILAVTQQLCEMCITVVNNLGLRICDDISLIGYDDTVLAQHLGITTVAHPFDEMIEKMVQWTIDKINGTSPAEISHIKIKPFLQMRNSVKNIKKS
ncbi:MAG: LacI family transcriptional regulator [Ruminococcaceae bacterium]|nr:LacI family transcriptional regulator [Oscillospiraceae bacterium]